MAAPNSTVGLFNQALALLGGEQLSSVEAPWEDSTLGRLCLNNFPPVLDLALNAHDWSFALCRVVLAGVEGPGPEYRYALPADCLRPVRVIGGRPFVIEGLEILTPAAPAELLYVRRTEDPARWPPNFRTALAWGLAAVLAVAKNNDIQKQQLCLQQYQLNLSEAMARDNNSQNPEDEPSEWIMARNGQSRRR